MNKKTSVQLNKDELDMLISWAPCDSSVYSSEDEEDFSTYLLNRLIKTRNNKNNT